jgi:hypothetical protein
MKYTIVTHKPKEEEEVKTLSLHGFWKKETILKICKKAGTELIKWMHCDIRGDGVHEVAQGDCDIETHTYKFRDNLDGVI